LSSLWPSPALATCRRSSVLSLRPGSRVPLATALDVAQLGLDIRLAQQSAEEFNGALDRSIASIFAASMT
jgi:hypothetical protein